jgi:hypothetical protein
MKMKAAIGALAAVLTTTTALAVEGTTPVPTATISNGRFTATIALPDAKKGYYRGTRFDQSGIVTSLKYKGHDYITPWSQIYDPAVVDFEYRGDMIATGAGSTMVGIPEEFTTLGWEDAAIGKTFVKPGVGALRKPDDKPYDHYRTYEIVEGGKWSVKKTATSITFTQTVHDLGSGYSYIYSKTIALVPGKSELTMAHTLRNTGSKPIEGVVYDHNFLRWDNETPGPDYSLHFAFDAKPTKPLGENPPIIYSGSTVRFTHALTGKEALRSEPVGFSDDARDYDFRVENSKLGIGLHIKGDRTLGSMVIWGMRTAFALEPRIHYDFPPGSAFSWKYDYQAYELGAAAK